jgi:hypothetical protein
MKNILIIIGIFLSSISYSQTNFGQSWILGLFRYSIKFDSNNIIHDTTISYLTPFLNGHSNISDSNGNALLISDGMNVYNKNGILIEDGDTLVPKAWADYNQNSASYPQSSIILPFANKKYYLITPALNDTQLSKSLGLGNPPHYGPCNLLLYHVIDMNVNGGLGKVTKRMVPLIENKELSKTQMMACRHANGKDWWLFKMAGDSNIVYKFLFTQDSVYNKGFQVIPFPWRGYYDLYGQMVFSKDATKWATTNTNFFGEVYLGDFDRCTGILSNFIKLSVPAQLSGYSPPMSIEDTNNTGLCFSPSGNLLYISRVTHVMQYNFSTQTFYKVCGWDTSAGAFAGYTSLMLAPDNKVYIGNFGGTTKQMSLIDNSDLAGPGCNFSPKCLRSKSVNGILTQPPCMPNYELGASGQTCWPLDNAETVKEDGLWEVYPNPAQGAIYIQHKDGKTKRLYNTLGQLLLETNTPMFDVSRLSKGIYFVQCEGVMKKVVVE